MLLQLHVHVCVADHAAPLDDATSLFISLAISSIAYDPYELTPSSGLLAADSLTLLMQSSFSTQTVTSSDVLPDNLGTAVLRGLTSVAAAAHTFAASTEGSAVTAALPDDSTAGNPVVYFGLEPSYPAPSIDRTTFAAIDAALNALSLAATRGDTLGLPPASFQAGSGVSYAAGGALYCSAALSFTAQRIDTATAASLASPPATRITEALGSCGGVGPLTPIAVPSAIFDSATWQAISASAGATTRIMLVQWGLVPVPRDPGWDGIEPAVLPLTARRLAFDTHSTSSGDIHAVERRLGSGGSCSQAVVAAISQNISESEAVHPPRNNTSGTTASRAVTVTLTDVNGTLISTWNVSANTSASYLSPTVSVVIPLLQGSNTLANIRRSLASRDPLTVRMQCPDSGASARKVTVGTRLAARYVSTYVHNASANESEATALVVHAALLREMSDASQNSSASRATTPLPSLTIYTVSVDCGQVGSVLVRCAQDFRVDSAPFTFVCPGEQISGAACGFWNASLAAWSGDGCRVSSVTADAVTCSCSHLTDFSARFTAVVDSQPLVIAAAVCVSDNVSVAGAYALWATLAVILCVFALLAAAGELADDVAAKHFEVFLASHPDLDLDLGNTDSDGLAGTPVQAGAACNMAVEERINAVPQKSITPALSAMSRFVRVCMPRGACSKLCAPCVVRPWECAVELSVCLMTSACCARRRATPGFQPDKGEHSSNGSIGATHHCCCCLRLTATQGRPQPRRLCCLPNRFTAALYRHYKALLLLGPGDDTAAISAEAVALDMNATPKQSTSASKSGGEGPTDCDALMSSSRGGTTRRAHEDNLLESVLKASPPRSALTRTFLFGRFILEIWMLRVLTCHPVLSVFTRFDPFRPRSNRLAVTFVTALASLFFAAFFFAFRARDDGAFAALPTEEVLVVIALSVAAGLPPRVLLTLAMERAGRAEFDRRHPTLAAELKVRSRWGHIAHKHFHRKPYNNCNPVRHGARSRRNSPVCRLGHYDAAFAAYHGFGNGSWAAQWPVLLHVHHQLSSIMTSMQEASHSLLGNKGQDAPSPRLTLPCALTPTRPLAPRPQSPPCQCLRAWVSPRMDG